MAGREFLTLAGGSDVPSPLGRRAQRQRISVIEIQTVAKGKGVAVSEIKRLAAAALVFCLGGVPLRPAAAQTAVGLDGGKPASEIVGDTGAPYENLFRPAHVGGSAAAPKIGPGRLTLPIPNISAPYYTIPLIERGFRPEDAEIKIGNLYVDVRAVDGTILVSDNINATEQTRKAGAISIATMSVALLYQINEGLQLATAGKLVWLPFRNEAGINGFGITDPLDVNFNAAPIARAQLVYDFTLGRWDVRLIDEFDVTTPTFAAGVQVDQQFEGATFDEADTAGRYRYFDTGGTGRRGATAFRDQGFERVDLVYHNRAGISAARDLPIDVRANLSYFHHNYWYGSRLKGGISELDEAQSSLISQRENMRFKPYVRHVSTTDDRRNGWDHQAVGGIFGPMSDYIDFLAEYGRYFQDHSVQSHSIWRVRLDHNPGPQTTHSIEYGRTISRPERTLATYMTYRIYRIFGPYWYGEAFAERIRSKSLTVGLSGYRQEQGGVRMTFDFGERLDLRTTALYQRIRVDNPAGEKLDNFIARAELVRRHTETMDSTILYEFTDRNSSVVGNSYYENLLIYTLRKSF